MYRSTHDSGQELLHLWYTLCKIFGLDIIHLIWVVYRSTSDKFQETINLGIDLCIDRILIFGQENIHLCLGGVCFLVKKSFMMSNIGL